MKEKKYYLYLNNDEIKIIIRSLLMLRNNLLNEERHPDCVDDMIIKIAKVKLK